MDKNRKVKLRIPFWEIQLFSLNNKLAQFPKMGLWGLLNVCKLKSPLSDKLFLRS